MAPLAKLQLVGPATVFAGVLASEGAVYALDRWPTSMTLWYLNLRLFDVFQQSHYILSSYVRLEYFQLFCIALPLLALAMWGIVCKRPLALGLASSLSFTYVCLLVCARYVTDAPTAQASLAPSIPVRPDFYLGLVLVGSSCLSCAVSHVGYIRAVMARGDDE